MMKCSDGVRIGPLSLVLEVGRPPFGVVDVIMIQVKNQFWYLVFRALFRVGESLKSQSSQQALFHSSELIRTFYVRGSLLIIGWYSKT